MRYRRVLWFVLAATLVASAACGRVGFDAETRDAAPDAPRDLGAPSLDGGPDAGAFDGGPRIDLGRVDLGSETRDAGGSDAGLDAGRRDAGVDAGTAIDLGTDAGPRADCGDTLCDTIGGETCETCALDCAVCPPPACMGTDGEWSGCRGNGCAVCDEMVGAFPRYFANHPSCAPNFTCMGVFFACNSSCPAPTAADM